MEVNISENSDEFNNIKNEVFFNKYRCIKRLGKGSFGCIYKAQYDQEYFALKFERRTKYSLDLLDKEASIMKYLKGTNIPHVYSYSSTKEYNILVMQMLGKSLDYYMEKFNIFSLKTVCMIGFQILSILEFIHNHHIIHRDIKPDNFCMGLNYISQNVYIIDFGLAKAYRNSKTLIQNPLVQKKGLNGTPRYASINALKGLEQSRRDDLESLGYVLMFFLRGGLPWQGIVAKSKEERNKKILEKKLEISASKLCEGFPEELEKFIDYVKNLEYTETPNYEMLRNLLMNIMKENNFKYDNVFDWTTKEEIRIRDNLEYWLNEEISSKKDIYIRYDSNRKNLKYQNNKNTKINIDNNNKITNINQSHEFLSIVRNNNNYYNDDKVNNANCTSACYIF